MVYLQFGLVFFPLMALLLVVGGCVWGLVQNRFFVGLRTFSGSERVRRMVTWVGIPVVGYVLAIVCNLGTQQLSSNPPAGLGVLTGGLALVVVVTTLVAVLRPARQEFWSTVRSWEALQGEVDERLADRRTPETGWLRGARNAWSRLSAESTPLSRRAEEAVKILGEDHGPIIDPFWGLAPRLRADGTSAAVGLVPVLRWSRGVGWCMWSLTSWVLAAVFVVWQAVVDLPGVGWTYALLFGVSLFVAGVLGVLCARLSLVYYARSHHEADSTSRDLDAVLRRWERFDEAGSRCERCGRGGACGDGAIFARKIGAMFKIMHKKYLMPNLRARPDGYRDGATGA